MQRRNLNINIYYIYKESDIFIFMLYIDNLSINRNNNSFIT